MIRTVTLENRTELSNHGRVAAHVNMAAAITARISVARFEVICGMQTSYHTTPSSLPVSLLRLESHQTVLTAAVDIEQHPLSEQQC